MWYSESVRIAGKLFTGCHKESIFENKIENHGFKGFFVGFFVIVVVCFLV